MVAAHERVKRKPAARRTVKLAANGRHVKIRRYLARLKRSLRNATKWAVFEPNGQTLWAKVRSTATNDPRWQFAPACASA